MRAIFCCVFEDDRGGLNGHLGLEARYVAQEMAQVLGNGDFSAYDSTNESGARTFVVLVNVSGDARDASRKVRSAVRYARKRYEFEGNITIELFSISGALPI